jgi:alpha-L-rhamnosidase
MWRTWGTAWSAGSLDLAAKMAAALQLEALARNDSASATAYAADHSYFADMATKPRTAFMNDLVQVDGSGTITAIWSSSPYSTRGSWSSTQGDCMTALHFNMIPDNKRADVLALLLNGPYGIAHYNSGFAADCTNHLSTGYYLAPRTMLELTRSGYTSKAYELLMDTSFPSWLYPVVNGATTFWEGWNSYISGPGSGHGYYPKAEPWNPFTSFNHGSYEGIAEWIWKVTGGINPDDSNPGFRNVIVKPEPGGGITNTFASFISIHGPIVCVWTNNPSSSNYTLNLTNPANTTASVYVPSTNNLAGILESGHAATSSPGIKSYYFTNWPNWPNGATVFQVGSGGYSFTVTNVSF